MLDLMKIARTEADGGNLFGHLQELFDPSDIQPTGYPDAESGKAVIIVER